MVRVCLTILPLIEFTRRPTNMNYTLHPKFRKLLIILWLFLDLFIYLFILHLGFRFDFLLFSPQQNLLAWKDNANLEGTQTSFLLSVLEFNSYPIWLLTVLEFNSYPKKLIFHIKQRGKKDFKTPKPVNFPFNGKFEVSMGNYESLNTRLSNMTKWIEEEKTKMM